jgi:hypothetical protein
MTTRNAHTPGPWIATPPRSGPGGAGDNAIGAIRGGPEPWAHRGMIAYMTNPTSLNLEGKANARLMAAAPMLLAVVEGFLSTLNGDEKDEAATESHFNLNIGLWNAAIEAQGLATNRLKSTRGVQDRWREFFTHKGGNGASQGKGE